MAYLEAAPSNRMFLESAQIRVSHSSHALTRQRALHGAAHQGASLSLRHPFEGAAEFFEMFDHATHAKVVS